MRVFMHVCVCVFHLVYTEYCTRDLLAETARFVPNPLTNESTHTRRLASLKRSSGPKSFHTLPSVVLGLVLVENSCIWRGRGRGAAAQRLQGSTHMLSIYIFLELFGGVEGVFKL